MNRRELFKRLAGATAAAGLAPIVAEAHEAPCDPARALVVLKSEEHLSRAQCVCLTDSWRRVTRGTAWEHVRCAVLERGMTLELHDLARFGVKR